MVRGVALSLELTEVLGAVQAARILVDLVASNHDIAESDQGHIEYAARAVLHLVEDRVDKLICVIRDELNPSELATRYNDAQLHRMSPNADTILEEWPIEKAIDRASEEVQRIKDGLRPRMTVESKDELDK